MDLRNADKIISVINALNSVTTIDADIANLLVGIIEQLEEVIAEAQDGVRISEWRRLMEVGNGR